VEREAEEVGCSQPTYSYNNIDDLIADRANRVRVLFGGGKGLRNRNYGFYLQDDRRVSRNLQLNAGIRYEYYPPFRGGFNTATSDPFGPFFRLKSRCSGQTGTTGDRGWVWSGIPVDDRSG
jgi:outer membrane receptor protein involved in Fe transport